MRCIPVLVAGVLGLCTHQLTLAVTSEYLWGTVQNYKGQDYQIFIETSGANPAGQLLDYATHSAQFTRIRVVDGNGTPVDSKETAFQIIGLFQDYLFLRSFDPTTIANKAVLLSEYGCGGGIYFDEGNQFQFMLPFGPEENTQSNIVFNTVSGLGNPSVRRRLWKEVFYQTVIQKPIQDAMDAIDEFQGYSPVFGNRYDEANKLVQRSNQLLNDIATSGGSCADIADAVLNGKITIVAAGARAIDKGWLTLDDLGNLMQRESQLTQLDGASEFLSKVGNWLTVLRVVTGEVGEVFKGISSHALAQGQAQERMKSLESMLLYAQSHGVLSDTEIMSGFSDAKEQFIDDQASEYTAVINALATGALTNTSKYGDIVNLAIGSLVSKGGALVKFSAPYGKYVGALGWSALSLVVSMTFDAIDRYDLIRHACLSLKLQDYLSSSLKMRIGQLSSCDADSVIGLRDIHSCIYFDGYYYFDCLVRVADRKWYNPADWAVLLLSWFSDTDSIGTLATEGGPRTLTQYKRLAGPYYSLAGAQDWVGMLIEAGIGPHLQISPTIVDCGQVPVGGNTTSVVGIANGGNSALTITAWASGNGAFTLAPANAVGTGGDVTLQPGESTDVQVTFSPGAVGAYNGTVQITSNDPLTPTAIVALIGTGVASQSGLTSTASPATVSYGSPVTVTATVRDPYGNPAAGQRVYFATGVAGSWSGYDGIDAGRAYKDTDTSGIAVVTYTPTELGLGTVTVTAPYGSPQYPTFTVSGPSNLQFIVTEFAKFGGDETYSDYYYYLHVVDSEGNPVRNERISWSVSPGTVTSTSGTMTNGSGNASLTFRVTQLGVSTATVTALLTDLGISNSTNQIVWVGAIPSYPAGRIIPLGISAIAMDLSSSGNRATFCTNWDVAVLDLVTEGILTANYNTENKLQGIHATEISTNADGSKIGLAMDYRRRAVISVGATALSDIFVTTPAGLNIRDSLAVAWLGDRLLLGHEKTSTTTSSQFSLYDTSANLLTSPYFSTDADDDVSAIAVRPGYSTQFAAVTDGTFNNDETDSHNWLVYGSASGSAISIMNRFLTPWKNQSVTWNGNGTRLVVGSDSPKEQIAVYEASAIGSGTPTGMIIDVGTVPDYIAFTSDSSYMAIARNAGPSVLIYQASGSPSGWSPLYRVTVPSCVGLEWVSGTHRLLVCEGSQVQYINLDDATPPSIAVLTPAQGYRTPAATVLVSGTITDASGIQSATIKVNGGTPQVLPLSSGSFSYEASLNLGQNTIEVGALDNAGWTATDTRSAIRFVEQVSIVGTDVSAAEPGTDTGTITMSRREAVAFPLAVNFGVGGSAVRGGDYVLREGGTTITGNVVTIPANQTSVMITLAPVDDTVIEGTETASIALVADATYTIDPVNGAASVSIADNDKPTVSVAASDPNASETGPDSGTFLITCSGNAAVPVTVTVGYAFGGSAAYGVDYTLSPSLPAVGTVQITLPVGGTGSATVVVNPITDAIMEVGGEDVTLTLNGEPGYSLGASTASVHISDGVVSNPPSITDAQVAGSLKAGQAGSVTVSCTATDSDGTVVSVTADLSQIGGSASQALVKGSGDSWSWSGSLTPASGGSKTITFTATDNDGGTRVAAAGIFVGTVLEFVTVGCPGNTGELSGEGVGGYGFDRLCGAVGYTYKIGKFEVTAEQYCEFLNKAAGVDPYCLYNTSMWSDASGCKIERFAGSGTPADPYQYRIAAGLASLPVNYVSWGDTARFCNWLTNGKPTGVLTGDPVQDLGLTEDGSYALNGATTASALLGVTRKASARYVIPTEDEWYKAAYHKNDGVTGNYWDYPTSSDTIDTSAANYSSSVGQTTAVKTYASNPSPYGTFDQGGNVWEWNETILSDTYGSTGRGLRGGAFYTDSAPLRASHRGLYDPTQEYEYFGFRVADVWNQVAAPVVSPASGAVFPSTMFVNMRCATTDATIRYTLDGGDPTPTTGTVFTPGSPIRLTQTTTIKAIACKAGMADSPVMQATYTKGAYVMPADINADGAVNVVDLLYLADSFGSVTGAPRFSAPCDLNSDGSVDMLDLLTMADNWGKVLHEEYHFDFGWGGSGSGNDQLSRPNSIAFDADGNVLVAEVQNNRVQKFSAAGQYLWTLDGTGGAGRFSWPMAVALDSAGNIYVVEEGNHRVQKFTADGTFIKPWGKQGGGDGEFLYPSDIVVDRSGYVYVADRHNRRIQKFTSDGQYVTQWGNEGAGPNQFASPQRLAVTASGNILVADGHWNTNNDRIMVFTPDGALITVWGGYGLGEDGLFYGPTGVAVDTNGFVYVTDSSGSRVQKFTEDGILLAKWGTDGSNPGQLNSPAGLAVDSSGNVYVADLDNDRIQVFAPGPAAP